MIFHCHLIGQFRHAGRMIFHRCLIGQFRHAGHMIFHCCLIGQLRHAGHMIFYGCLIGHFRHAGHMIFHRCLIGQFRHAGHMIFHCRLIGQFRLAGHMIFHWCLKRRIWGTRWRAETLIIRWVKSHSDTISNLARGRDRIGNFRWNRSAVGFWVSSAWVSTEPFRTRTRKNWKSFIIKQHFNFTGRSVFLTVDWTGVRWGQCLVSGDSHLFLSKDNRALDAFLLYLIFLCWCFLPHFRRIILTSWNSPLSSFWGIGSGLLNKALVHFSPCTFSHCVQFRYPRKLLCYFPCCFVSVHHSATLTLS